MRTSLALGGLVALGLVAAAASWLHVRRDVPVEAAHPEVAPSAWTAYRSAIENAPLPELADDAALLAAFEALNRAEVAGAADPQAPGPGPAAEAWAARARIYVESWGMERYVALGRRVALAFGDRLFDALAWSRQAGRPLDAAVLEPDPPPVVAAWRDLGGLFARFAERGGFVQDDALVPSRRPLLQAVFLDQWLRPLRDRWQVQAHLDGREYEWLLRWRAEWQLDGRPERRVEAADALRTLPGYPADLNAGVVLYHAGRFDEAARRFARAKGPQAVAYRRMAERAAGR